MKKIILVMLTAYIFIPPAFTQTKNYLSIETGISFSGMSNRLNNNMKANGFGDKINYDIYLFFFYLSGSTQYPRQETSNGNYKIRYGYHIKKNAGIEAGFGRTYRTVVKGADGYGYNVNLLNISSEFSTAYAAYLWKNKKGNAAVGIGPVVSICKIKQESPYSSTPLSEKKYLLPGAIFTGYWNFLNKKSWFMGVRSDMTITSSAKTATVKVINPDDNNFISVSKGTGIGGIINTVSLSAGIKF